MLPDGDYEGSVVDAQSHDDRATLSIAITAGTHRGEVVDIASTASDDEIVALLGLPCALSVRSGVPDLTFHQ